MSVMRRIAVLRALFLGDFICAEPALRALKTRFPRAEVTLIGLPWIEPLLERYACVDDFLAFPGCAGVREVPYRAEATQSFLAEARERRFDMAIQMHGSGPESSDFVACLGARISLGFTPPGMPSPLTRPVPYPGDHVHEARKWLGLVAHVGATGSPRPELPVLPEEQAVAAQLCAELDPTKPVVALHAGSREPARRWLPVRFAALADRLWDTRSCQILLTGSDRDAEDNAQVLRAARAPILDLTGRTTIGTLAALLERCALLVTNDSGPSHVAWARRVPSVILFGPTDPARWAPLEGGLHRAVVSPSRRLQDLSLAQVWTVVANMLERTRRRCASRAGTPVPAGQAGR
jgi:ADP-heptose:LPS heptosyltransferase